MSELPVEIFDEHKPGDGWLRLPDGDYGDPSLAFTLVFMIQEDRVLLGRKKRGFGQGRHNGFGGKLELNESLIQGAAREVLEETGLVVSPEDLVDAGQIDIVRPGRTPSDSPILARLYLFTCRKWQGTPRETEEMEPRWFTIAPGPDAIPYDNMWPEARMYLPRLLEGRAVAGRVDYKDGSSLSAWRLGWKRKP